MLRRRFLGFAGMAGAGGIAAIGSAKAMEKSTVVFRVKGFTCVTCAVGLEVLLRREAGVVAAKASYPEALATVTFRPGIVSEASVAEFIAGAGFVPERV